MQYWVSFLLKFLLFQGKEFPVEVYLHSTIEQHCILLL